jgi:drug/metabolite transporter (DMT)-like permease
MRTARRSARLDRGLLLLLTPILWGATFPAAKLGIQRMHPFAFMAWTRVLGLATIALALWWLGREGTDRDTLRRVARPAVLLGALIFAGYTLQTLGLELTTATNAGFITGLYVVLVPLLGIVLFREAAGRAAWAAVALAVAGLGLLSTATLTSFQPRPGDLLVLGGALAWAGHVVALSRLAPLFPPRLLSLAQMVTTVAFQLGAAAFVGFEASDAVRAGHLLLITGVLGTGVAYTLQIVAQRDLSPARAAVILSGESLASALISIVWLGERLAPHQWLGGGLIIAAMITSELGARRGSPVAPGPA